jgi:predicted kinase
LSPTAPTAFLLCGPSLAGKSTFAAALDGLLHAVTISADAINAERGLPFGGEGLGESVWAETLRIQLERLREAGALRVPVVVDDTLCYRWLRDRFRAEAQASGLQTSLLLFRPTVHELLARHARALEAQLRPVLSIERLREHLLRFEWPSSDEGAIEVTSSVQQASLLAALAPAHNNAGHNAPRPSEPE